MIRSILGYSGIEGIAKALNIILSLVLAALLSVSNYGIIATLITVELVMTEIILLGQNTYILRYFRISNLERFRNNYIAASTIILCSTVLLLIAIYFSQIELLFEQGDEAVRSSIFVLILGIFLQSNVTLYLMYLRSAEKIKHYGVLRVSSQALKFLFSLVFITYFNDPLFYPAGIFISSIIIVMIIQFVRTDTWRPPQILSSKIDYASLVDNMKFGLPIAIHGIIGALYSVLDRIFLANLINMEAVAVYNFALTQGTSVFFFINIIAVALIPRFYDGESLNDTSRRYLNIFLVSSVISVLILSLTVYYIIFPISLKFVSAEYQLGINVLPLFSVVMVASCFSNYAVYKLTALKSVNMLPFFTIISLSLNITLIMVLIPKYGMNGAAYGLVLSELTYAIMLNAYASIYLRLEGER